MCGIVGIVFSDSTQVVPVDKIQTAVKVLRHRGPNDSNIYLRNGIALGSSRLAILDLSENGRMPMQSLDGRFVITYNGEIYNYRSLRAELVKSGAVFRSNTDTEVILNLYSKLGPSMVEVLNGMFAIAIWDNVRRELFLARDRFGIKPLYLHCTDQYLIFASEEKALFAAGAPKEFNEKVVEELFCFRYIAGSTTPFRGIERLLPGHWALWRAGAIRCVRWWHLGERLNEAPREEKGKAVYWFRELFDESVKSHSISDVPIGILLSGGLDSSTIAASLALQEEAAVETFTIRFRENGYDEGLIAKKICDRYRLKGNFLIIEPESVMPLLQRATVFHDEPLAHGSDIHILAISEVAKEKVTVLLSGEGADEILGGYVRYQPFKWRFILGVGQAVAKLGLPIGAFPRRVRKLGKFLKECGLEEFVLFNAADVLPGDLRAAGFEPNGEYPYRQRVLEEAKRLFPRSLLRQVMYCDLHTFLCSLLDRNDRMTMGASIECRVPFLDWRLVQGLFALPERLVHSPFTRKKLLRLAMNDRLPVEVRRHPKVGLAVPWRKYVSQSADLRTFVESLTASELCLNGVFDRNRIEGIIKSYLAGEDRWEAFVRQFVMFEVWWHSVILENGI